MSERRKFFTTGKGRVTVTLPASFTVGRTYKEAGKVDENISFSVRYDLSGIGPEDEDALARIIAAQLNIMASTARYKYMSREELFELEGEQDDLSLREILDEWQIPFPETVARRGRVALFPAELWEHAPAEALAVKEFCERNPQLLAALRATYTRGISPEVAVEKRRDWESAARTLSL